ncbi:MAG: hypothetical protein RMK51_09900, partial [Meiothermus sp.]|uniref:hypothetical protein n=1 Tax=Meiothermus sp. TaxID=1955249 RepID=UPI00298EECB1
KTRLAVLPVPAEATRTFMGYGPSSTVFENHEPWPTYKPGTSIYPASSMGIIITATDFYYIASSGPSFGICLDRKPSLVPLGKGLVFYEELERRR